MKAQDSLTTYKLTTQLARFLWHPYLALVCNTGIAGEVPFHGAVVHISSKTAIYRMREKPINSDEKKILWEAAAEDHRAASWMQPTLTPGLTEEVDLRAGMKKKDCILGGQAALPQTTAADAQLTKLLTNSDWSRQTKISDNSLKNDVSAYSTVHSGSTQLLKQWMGRERK